MKKTVLLELLDEERRLAGSQDSNGIVREWSADHNECRILYGPSIDDGLIEIVRSEQTKARAEGYELEWKTYSHNSSEALLSVLTDAGFDAGDEESVLAADVNAIDSNDVKQPECVVRIESDERGLDAIASISRRSGQCYRGPSG